ncbi:MAG: hypothetical protein ABL929_01170 [Ferruginibacter sp.]|nr:hypothetical protein [Ferruginibacter sp.]
MRLQIISTLFFLFFAVPAFSMPTTLGFDKTAFYEAMESEKISDIEAQLIIIKNSTIAEKNAYEGALLMKKSGMVNKAKDKLHFFKIGRVKLEAAIEADKDNTEYRFIRLILQEHAPKIVKYRNEINEDSKLIKSNFKQLPSFLQKTIAAYCKSSKVLKID